MNKRRKVKLAQRAWQYGSTQAVENRAIMDAAADGFEKGYRAAMRDMRKVIADSKAARLNSEVAVIPDMRAFLRPLR